MQILNINPVTQYSTSCVRMFFAIFSLSDIWFLNVFCCCLQEVLHHWLLVWVLVPSLVSVHTWHRWIHETIIWLAVKSWSHSSLIYVTLISFIPGTSLALAGLMGYRFYNSGKFMPAGLVFTLSAFMVFRFGLRLVLNRNYFWAWKNILHKFIYSNWSTTLESTRFSHNNFRYFKSGFLSEILHFLYSSQVFGIKNVLWFQISLLKFRFPWCFGCCCCVPIFSVVCHQKVNYPDGSKHTQKEEEKSVGISGFWNGMNEKGREGAWHKLWTFAKVIVLLWLFVHKFVKSAWNGQGISRETDYPFHSHCGLVLTNQPETNGKLPAVAIVQWPRQAKSMNQVQVPNKFWPFPSSFGVRSMGMIAKLNL